MIHYLYCMLAFTSEIFWLLFHNFLSLVMVAFFHLKPCHQSQVPQGYPLHGLSTVVEPLLLWVYLAPRRAGYGSATIVHFRVHPSGWSLSLAGWDCFGHTDVWSWPPVWLAAFLQVLCEPCLLEWEILWRSAGQGSSQRGVGAEFMVLARLMERWQRCHQRQTN